MHHRSFPLILLYGFGLALALSFAFIGFLLYEQNRRVFVQESQLVNVERPIDVLNWQQQLSECRRANEQKDSLIRQLQLPK